MPGIRAGLDIGKKRHHAVVIPRYRTVPSPGQDADERGNHSSSSTSTATTTGPVISSDGSRAITRYLELLPGEEAAETAGREQQQAAAAPPQQAARRVPVQVRARPLRTP